MKVIKIKYYVLMVCVLVGLIIVNKVIDANKKNLNTVEADESPFVWLVETDLINHVKIELARAGLEESWVKREDGYWYFERSNNDQAVDIKRWGGGVPFLLSGPKSMRRIINVESDEELKKYGFQEPQMIVTITIADKSVIKAIVGDATPDQQAYYISLAGSKEVYSVDASWVAVIQGLVIDPPYPRSILPPRDESRATRVS
jgi:hypothetical protein